ncbi:MAG: hypothetical protein LBJ14_03535 [Desulfarculales bacterium]|jgi:hypothetical protein|nr:hypothetical protein [Desulfarculales bacterium]
MKLDDYFNQILNIGNNTTLGNQNKIRNNSGDISFAEQLNQILQNNSSVPDIAEDSLSIDRGMEESQSVAGLAPEVDRAGLNRTIASLDNLLDILEKYETALADPSVSLKNIAPLVKDMQEEAERLESSLEKIDTSLFPLADQILAQTKIETIKFNRGDYIE